MKVELSAQADADVQNIIEQGLIQFGVNQVASYLDGLEHAFKLLGEFPKTGIERPEFEQPIRTYAYRSHVIFYRVEAGRVFITRIRHGHEDWRPE